MTPRSLTLKELKQYRAFLFPEILSKKDHKPYFSLEHQETWVVPAALHYFIDDMNVVQTTKDEGSSGDAFWETQTVSMMRKYRDFILPPTTASLPFFELDNADIWVLDAPFRLFVKSHNSSGIEMEEKSNFASQVPVPDASQAIKQEVSEPHLHAVTRKRKAASPPGSDVEIIEISDSDDQTVPASVPPRKPKRKQKKIKLEHSRTIDLTSDVEQKSIPHPRKGKGKAKPRPQPKDLMSLHAPLDTDTRHKITSKAYVSELKHISEIPLHWDVSYELTAYVLDLSDEDRFSDDKSLMHWIRHESQSSWSGSSGKVDGDAEVEAGILADDKVKCRRADLLCTGVKICEFFDRALLDGFEGWECENDEMNHIWEKELDANENQARNPDGPLLRFYRHVMDSTCRIACRGKPTIRKPKSSDPHGRRPFIGCTDWRVDEKGIHRCIQIPANVDVKEFTEMMKTGGKIKDTDPEKTVYGTCSLILSPRSHKSICTYTHVIEGEVKSGRVVQYEPRCPSRLVIFTPTDPAIRKALVIPKFPHNHPRYPHVKPSFQEKELLKDLVKSSGKTKATVKELQLSANTATILNGESWDNRLPGYVDNRRVRKAVQKLNEESYPKGYDWEGVQYQMTERDSKLPPEKRYIHSVISRDDVRLIVTMHPGLVKHIHSVRFLAIDYTFKRVQGEFNEWEVATIIDRYNRRASVASLYCNKADRRAFRLLVHEFFDTVERVMKKKLEFHLFNQSANLHCLLFDAEAAQIQGCGDEVVKMNKPETSGISTTDPLVLIQHVIKTCIEHFIRNIDSLPKHISRETINRLKGFRHLDSHEDIAEWRNFCLTSPHKEIINWYKQKEMHPWYLPSVNAFLSPMKSESWRITPDDTNVSESAHALRNAETGINLPLLVAIQNARKRDEEIALQFDSMEKNPGNTMNRWNGMFEREKNNAARRDATKRKIEAVDSARSKYSDLIEKQQDFKDAKKQSLERKREIAKRLEEIKNILPQHSSVSTIAIELKKERAALGREEKLGVDNRRLWAAEDVKLQSLLDELEETELKNRRVRDSRPSSAAATPGNSPQKETQDTESRFNTSNFVSPLPVDVEVAPAMDDTDTSNISAGNDLSITSLDRIFPGLAAAQNNQQDSEDDTMQDIDWTQFEDEQWFEFV